MVHDIDVDVDVNMLNYSFEAFIVDQSLNPIDVYLLCNYLQIVRDDITIFIYTFFLLCLLWIDLPVMWTQYLNGMLWWCNVKVAVYLRAGTTEKKNIRSNRGWIVNFQFNSVSSFQLTLAHLNLEYYRLVIYRAACFIGIFSMWSLTCITCLLFNSIIQKLVI